MSAFLRAEMILESYGEVDSNQFTTGNTPHQPVQSSTVPINKKNYKYVNQHMIPLPITRNSSCVRQPLSLVNLTGFTTPTSG